MNKPISVIWLIYFVIWFLITSFSLTLLLEFENRGTIDYLDFLLLPIDVVFIYGFILKKPIASKRVWQLYFYLCIGWLFIYPFITNIDFQSDIPTHYFILGQAISFLIFAPKYIAMYLYGFKSDDTWANKNA